MQRGSTFEDLVMRSKKMKTYCNFDTWVKSYSILNFLNTINYMTSVLFACVWRNRERLLINGSRGLVGLVFLPLSTFVTRDIKFPIWVMRWRLQFIAAALPRRVHGKEHQEFYVRTATRIKLIHTMVGTWPNWLEIRNLIYSLRPIILFANIDVSRPILVVHTSVLTNNNMDRREYLACMKIIPGTILWLP
jgi:hypothetical protein